MTGKNSNTTDKLVIDIKVNVKKGATTQITNLTKSLTKLNEVVKNTANIEKYANALKTIGKELTRTTANKGVAQAQLGNKNLTEQMDFGGSKQAQETKEQDKVEKKIKKTIFQRISLRIQEWKEARKLKNEEKDIKKADSFFAKFGRSIGRIALYRAIRAGLSSIVKASKEGLQLFAQYDETTNKSISNIINSGNQIKASLGASLGQILVSLEPIITNLSDVVAGFLDKINMALAIMQGDKSYKKAIKNNEDYAKSLEETNKQLLSFDKFESLNSKDTQRYETVNINDEDIENVSKFTSFFQTIKDLVSSVWSLLQNIWTQLEETGILDTIVDIIEFILNLVQNVVQWITNGINWLKEQGWLDEFLWGLVAVLGAIGVALAVIAIKNVLVNMTNPFGWIMLAVTAVIAIIGVLVTYWDEISNWFKETFTAIGDFFVGVWKGIANGFASIINFISNLFIGFINGIIDGLNILLKPIDMIAGIFGGKVEIPHWDAQVNWQPYAIGGMVEKGTRFIAGEAGAEVVHTSARGTGVTNIEQFSQAMLQALATYGVARGSDVSFKGDVYIDRTKAGQLLEGSVYGEGVRVGHFKRV